MADELYMRRALELAERGLGASSPNPMVGCVVVNNNEIIGEGWHRKFGEAHAEVNAIASVDDKSLLSASTLYLTLEPCSFKGKTPACTDLLVQHKVKKVFIAAIDPNPRVSGNGIARLRKSGIEVKVGLLGDESSELNRRFHVNITKERPYVILKWAETADGFLAREDHDSKWISNELSRQLVHKWRSEEDAILVGRNTVVYDDPLLTIRDWSGRNPVRVVLDRNLKLSDKYHVMDQKVPTLVYNTCENRDKKNLIYVQLPKEEFLLKMLEDLYQRNLGTVLVEGGAQVLHSFIEKNLWDEARVFSSKMVFGAGIAAPKLSLSAMEEIEIMDDRLSIFRNY